MFAKKEKPDITVWPTIKGEKKHQFPLKQVNRGV